MIASVGKTGHWIAALNVQDQVNELRSLDHRLERCNAVEGQDILRTRWSESSANKYDRTLPPEHHIRITYSD